MNITSISTAFTTERVAETRDFYVNHLGARVTFDCGWYVSLEFGAGAASLQFMSLQKPGHELSSGAGITYNLLVDDVDAAYSRLTGAGLEIAIPLEGHPWGDRGFGIMDPNGITVYLYVDTEPDDEFRQYYR